MAKKTFQSLAAFKTGNPVLNHSSRVYIIDPLTGLPVLVIDDVVATPNGYGLIIDDVTAGEHFFLSIDDALAGALYLSIDDVEAAEVLGFMLSINNVTAVDGAGLPIISINDVSDGEDSTPTFYAGNASVTPDLVFVAGDGFYTAGRDILDESGDVLQLRSVAWFGGEAENFVPNLLWPTATNYKSIIDNIASWGFNCIRFPFSGTSADPALMPNSGAIDYVQNPELTGLTVLEVYDELFNYAATKGLHILLDFHHRTAYSGLDGKPTDGGFTQASLIAAWGVMATRYKDFPNVVGADIYNEPWTLTWDAWASLCEDVGNAILAIAPRFLIVVQGVFTHNGHNWWYGGQLEGVATRPVVLSTPNKVVYSPHEYGQSVGGTQTWLQYDGGGAPSGWPNNLYPLQEQNWAYIWKENIAPILIGEFGGWFGYDNNGNLTKPHYVYERQWLTTMQNWILGTVPGASGWEIPPGGSKMSFAYWCYQFNSGDTGGLVQADSVTPQTAKLALLSPILS